MIRNLPSFLLLPLLDPHCNGIERPTPPDPQATFDMIERGLIASAHSGVVVPVGIDGEEGDTVRAKETELARIERHEWCSLREAVTRVAHSIDWWAVARDSEPRLSRIERSHTDHVTTIRIVLRSCGKDVLEASQAVRVDDKRLASEGGDQAVIVDCHRHNRCRREIVNATGLMIRRCHKKLV